MLKTLPFLLDRFIPESLVENSDTLTRSRILVSLLLATLCVGLLGEVASLARSGVSGDMSRGNFMSLVSMIPAAVALFILKRFSSLVIASVFFGILQSVVIVGFILLTGDYFLSPVIHMLIIIPVIQFLVNGQLAGVIWTGIIIIINISLLAMSVLGIEVVKIDGQTDVAAQHALTSSFVIVFVAIVGIVYEKVGRGLRQQLRLERNNFHYQARHDPLTQLANRKSFYKILKTALVHARRLSEPVAVIFIDLNEFKPINDTYGHAAGDELLKHTAAQIVSALRHSDTAFRLGGDEFVVILPGGDEGRALITAKHIAKAIAEPLVRETRTLQVSSCMGVACYPADGDSVAILCQRADQAMYAAKRSGMDLCLFDKPPVNFSSL